MLSKDTVQTDLIPLFPCALIWIDINGDNYADLLTLGRLELNGVSHMYINDGMGKLIRSSDQPFEIPSILHAISVSGLISLLLLKLNSLFLALLAILIFLINQIIPQPLEGDYFWQWLIYTTETPNSLDYRPIIPWITPFILGMASCQLFRKWGLLEPRKRTIHRELSILSWLGRNSLIIYLLHQPILFGGFLLFLQIG